MDSMNRIYRFVITLILLFNIGITIAQSISDDYLKPVGGIYDIYNFQFEYYSKVRKVLFSGLSDKPEIRFQIMPSFTPENVLDIEFDKDKVKYYIIYQICTQMIWNNEKWEKIKVSRFKTEIDEKSVKLLKSLFSKAIAQVRFPPEVKEGERSTIRFDGTDYYFTVNERGYGLKSGIVWSPDKGTKMAKLVDIGCELIELAKSKKEIVKIEGKLQKDIEELIVELK